MKSIKNCKFPEFFLLNGGVGGTKFSLIEISAEISFAQHFFSLDFDKLPGERGLCFFGVS